MRGEDLARRKENYLQVVNLVEAKLKSRDSRSTTALQEIREHVEGVFGRRKGLPFFLFLMLRNLNPL